MRTIVDLPKEQIRALDDYRRRHKVSRAEAVRRAVDAFVPPRPKCKIDWMKHPAFGSWKGKKVDSVAHVRKLRSEWDHRA